MSDPVIRNIIFDLGGVIIDIDYHKTTDAFQRFGVSNFNDYYSQKKQLPIFSEFEIGKINDFEFRNGLRALFKCDLNDHQIDVAWNAMLLDFPIERLHYIYELKSRYNLYLFSNTNIIHMRAVTNKFKLLNLPVDSLDSLFHECYYSYTFGLRKPHAESFLEILRCNRLDASETLFIDDTERHVEGARKAGLHSLHFESGLNLLHLEDKFIPQLLQELQT